MSPHLGTLRNGKWTPDLSPGQSYEIRLLENRKLGDFQDLNTKYVKVSLWALSLPKGPVGVSALGALWWSGVAWGFGESPEGERTLFPQELSRGLEQATAESPSGVG